MKKIYRLLVLYLFIIQSSFSANFSCEEPDYGVVEGFSSRTLFKVPPDWKEERGENPYDLGQRRGQLAEFYADLLFKRAGFFSCPSKHPVGNQGADGLYILLTELTQQPAIRRGRPVIILNEVKYRKSGSFDLGEMGCMKCRGASERCHQLSWKWCFNAIEWIEAKSETYCSDKRVERKCKTICPFIQENLLSKGGDEESFKEVLIRTGIFVDENFRFTFYAVGDSDDEINASATILGSLLPPHT